MAPALVLRDTIFMLVGGVVAVGMYLFWNTLEEKQEDTNEQPDDGVSHETEARTGKKDKDKEAKSWGAGLYAEQERRREEELFLEASVVAEGFRKKSAIAIEEERFEEAVALCTQGLEQDEGNIVLFSNRALALARMERWEASLKDANEAIGRASDFSKPYMRKGEALLHLERFEEAIEAYRIGLEKDPSNVLMLEGYHRALGENRLSHVRDLLLADAKCKEHMNDPTYREKLMLFLVKPSREHELVEQLPPLALAIDLIQKKGETQPIEKKVPDVEQIQAMQGLVHEEEEDDMDAAQRATVYSEDGDRLRGEGHLQEAIARYSEAITLSEHAVHLARRAYANFLCGRMWDCISDCQRALACGEEKDVQGRIYELQGDAFLKLEQPEKAKEAYKASLALLDSAKVQEKMAGL